MVSATNGGVAAADRTRLGRRKEQQMKFASHQRGRTAARARDAKRQARQVLRRGRAGALILGLAAAAAIAVPASASASTGASPVVGHVYVNDNTKGTNAIGAFDRHADGSLTPVAGSAFAAGGAGTGAGLASQGAIQITPDGGFLIAVDAGSNQISVLRIHFDGSLSLVSVRRLRRHPARQRRRARPPGVRGQLRCRRRQLHRLPARLQRPPVSDPPVDRHAGRQRRAR